MQKNKFVLVYQSLFEQIGTRKSSFLCETQLLIDRSSRLKNKKEEIILDYAET